VSHVITQKPALAGGRATVLFLATVLLAATAAMQAVPGVLGPLLESDLHISQATLGLLAAAATGGMALGMLPGGLLTDRFGERPIMSIGVAGAGLMMFIASSESEPNWLFVLFLAASIGAAFAATGGPKTIVRWFAPNRRGTAMGIRQTGVPIGGLLASLALPSVAIATDWRFALRCAAVAAVILAVLFYALYRDPLGVVPSERITGKPSIFRSRRFLAATACATTLQCAQASTLTYLTVDLHQLLGLSAVVAALFLAIALVGGVAGRIGWGALGDIIGNRRALTAVSAIAAVCCLAMSAINPGTNLIIVAVICLALGLTTTSWNAVYISLVAAMAPDRTGSALGVGLTAVLAGFLFAPFFGLLADQAHSFRPAWIAVALVLAVGAGLSFAARPTTVQPVR
jgi:MFS family permease